ncbi:acyl-CoA dehydrogenase/oxidase [Cladochytrium replicatum]|nr:acyl-CoA dehydrogenase/oxidase [Cladochytrium replicatum]
MSLAAVCDALDGLGDEEAEIYAMARAFADKEMAPHAEEWDEKEVFPVGVMRQAASLAFGAMYCDPTYGGTGLSRLAASVVFEALSTADPSSAAFISIHNMVYYGATAASHSRTSSVPKAKASTSPCTVSMAGESTSQAAVSERGPPANNRLRQIAQAVLDTHRFVPEHSV